MACHDNEKLALLLFKQSFLVDCGASVSAFAYPKVESWHEPYGMQNGSGNCCKWDGVECSNETGRVISLDLSSSCLSSTFPPNNTLISLDYLQQLNLADNFFDYSRIPSEIGLLRKLTSLNLSNSGFTGQVPPEIAYLSSLSILDLSHEGDPSGLGNKYSLKLRDLSLDTLIKNLTHLSQLHLDCVDISSDVPLQLSNLTSLKSLTLIGCNLSGKLPTHLLLLSNLEKVSFRYNYNLRGYLPDQFRPDSRLRFLSLAYTQLSTLVLKKLNINPAVLDSWLLKLNKLTRLGLSNVITSGDIPTVLANRTRLTYLDLRYNQLTSTLPLWFENLIELTALDLWGNHLKGHLPKWVPELVNLNTLAFSFRESKGEFDMFLKLPYLQSLSLSGVDLTFGQTSIMNSSSLKFDILVLDFCDLNDFPQFLRNQDKLRFLSFSGNSISGNIPPWFVNITKENLLSLNLSGNFLTGFEPPSDLLQWENLEVLDLSGNKLKGRLPSPPKLLQIFHASKNQFSGVVPDKLCDSSNLIYLDLSENQLSGQIPSYISHQLGQTLQVLNLRDNNFHGIIPETFTKSCKLKMINLSQNQLKRRLPNTLVNCMMLEVLDVGKNHVNDTFPSWLGSLPKLQVLVLRHNNFHGKIDAQLGHGFPSLRIIDLSNNFHFGNLPSRYFENWPAMRVSNGQKSRSSNSIVRLVYTILHGSSFSQDLRFDYCITITDKGSKTYYSRVLTVFRVIDFSSNSFTGGIPDLIGDLNGLQALNLSNNCLEGGIPASLANITELKSLDFSENMLIGEIPEELTELTSLEVFNISNNHLVGEIPQGRQFNTFDDGSFSGNLALCGAPLTVKCGKEHSSLTAPLSQSINDETIMDGDFEFIDWFIRLSGYASGCLFGYIIGKVYITDRHHDWFMDTFGRRRPTARVNRAARNRRHK
ncbi:hypothetical protein RND81_10G235800 [Saponaria officinalis]|uniref:Leucine-rich repeat-containing N-terminal plant-type domain-containing protein n=1 Tax=Saponaria officinalis TaxID=3572 RepID=A0AAW1I6I0_SAPOF